MNFKYIANHKDPVMVFPAELIRIIFSELSYEDLKACRNVSEAWRIHANPLVIKHEAESINSQNIDITYHQSHLTFLSSYNKFEEHLIQIFSWLTPSLIQQIDLSNSQFVDDEWLNLIKINCPNIKAINLRSCPEISTTGVLSLVDNTKITFLNLSWCRKISTETLEQNKPKCFHLISTPWNRTLQRCEG